MRRNISFILGWARLWLASTRRRPWRIVLTTAVFAVGIALFVAVQILQQAAGGSFTRTLMALAGKAELVVTADAGELPADLLRPIAEAEGVGLALPRVVRSTQMRDARGAQALTCVGVDWAKESLARSTRVLAGELLGSDANVLFEPDAVVVTRSLARERGLTLGDALELMTTSGWKTYVIRAWIEPVGVARAYGGRIALVELTEAQRSFGRPNAFDRIDLMIDPAGERDDVCARVQAIVGGGRNVGLHAARGRAAQGALATYRVTLALFALLALGVALVALAASMQFGVALRTRELATLSALGAAPADLRWVVYSEALAIALVAAVLGVALGWGVAGTIASSVESSILVQLGEPVALDVGFVPVWLLWATLIGACVLACCVSVPAARRAATLAPAALWRTYDRRVQPISLRAAALGLVALGLVCLSAQQHLSFEQPAVRALNVVLALVATIMLAPLGGVLAARVALLAWGRNNAIGLLIGRGLQRDGGDARAFMRVVAVGLGTSLVLATLRTSLAQTLGDALSGELTAPIVIGHGVELNGQQSLIAPDVVELVKSDSGVVRVVAERRRAVRFGSDLVQVIGRDDLARAAGLTVSRRLARSYDLELGQSIELGVADGVRSFAIGALRDMPLEREPALELALADYREHWSDDRIGRLLVFLDRGADPAVVRDRLQTALGERFTQPVFLASELYAAVLDSVDQGFAFTRAIERGVLLLAALAAVLITALVFVRRAAEVGTLRRIGMSRRATRARAALEFGVLGTGTSLVALAVSLVVAFAWTTWTLPDVLGWQVAFSIPSADALRVPVIGGLIGGVAGCCFDRFRTPA